MAKQKDDGKDRSLSLAQLVAAAKGVQKVMSLTPEPPLSGTEPQLLDWLKAAKSHVAAADKFDDKTTAVLQKLEGEKPVASPVAADKKDKKKKAKNVKGGGGKGGKAATNFDKEAKITVLVKENPKRKGSLSAKRFSNYKTGMTVAEAIEKGLGPDLAWDISHGFIKVK